MNHTLHPCDPPGRRPPSPQRRHASRRIRVVAQIGVVAALSIAAVAGVPVAAQAADPGPIVLAADSIQEVANNIRLWLIGILIAVATVFLTVAGLLYMTANGDPGQIDKARTAFRSALIGYALALLAPLFVTIVGEWVA